MADLVMCTGVPGSRLDKLLRSLPIVQSESELVPIDVRLAEVGAVLDESFEVTIGDFLLNEGLGLLFELLCEFGS